MPSEDLASCIRFTIEYRFSKLFITPPKMYHIFKTLVIQYAKPHRAREINVAQMGDKEACDVFRESAQSPDVLIVKVEKELPWGLKSLISEYYNGMPGYQRITLANGRAATVNDDFVLILWMTPEAYKKMRKSSNMYFYPPKDAYYFPNDPRQRSWDIFKR